MITGISYFVVSDNLQKNLIQTAETRLSFLCSSIDSNISDVKSFAYSCKNKSDCSPIAGSHLRTEEIPLADEKLRAAWRDAVYRTLAADTGTIEMHIW